MDKRELRLDEMEQIAGGELDQSTWEPEDVAAYYRVIHDYAEAVKAHAKYSELDLDKAASITSVPYHPGAAKFFSEKGKTVKTA